MGVIMSVVVSSTPLCLKTISKLNQVCTTVNVKSSAIPKKGLTEMMKAVPLLVTQPALALVDDRLAGEGTGKALGINDPILGWVIIGVFTLIWAFYYIATKDLGGQRDEDGLDL